MRSAAKTGRGKFCKRCKSTALTGPEGNICPTCSVRFCSLCHGGVYHIDRVTGDVSKNCTSCGDSSSEDEEVPTKNQTSVVSSAVPPSHQYPTRSQRLHQGLLAKSQPRKTRQLASKDDKHGNNELKTPLLARSSPLATAKPPKAVDNRKSGSSSKREVDTPVLTSKKRVRRIDLASSDEEDDGTNNPYYLLASEKQKAGAAKIVDEPIIERKLRASTGLKMRAPAQGSTGDLPRDHRKRKSIKMSQDLVI